MAKVQGVKEKLHLPIYDAFFVQQNETFRAAMERQDPRVIRFFVDVQNKTRLETNMQAAGVLPSLNTFEARAMRVVVSGLPRCPNPEDLKKPLEDLYDLWGKYQKSGAQQTERQKPTAEDVCSALRKLCALAPDASTILAELIYNSVTTLLVGEKIMIEVPTFYFPAGAGVSEGNGTVTNHGDASPLATFRFAEPVIIEPNQNFRVEMLFPRGVPGQVPGTGNLADVQGPLRIWVVLDGYLTRDVQ